MASRRKRHVAKTYVSPYVQRLSARRDLPPGIFPRVPASKQTRSLPALDRVGRRSSQDGQWQLAGDRAIDEDDGGDPAGMRGGASLLGPASSVVAAAPAAAAGNRGPVRVPTGELEMKEGKSGGAAAGTPATTTNRGKKERSRSPSPAPSPDGGVGDESMDGNLAELERVLQDAGGSDGNGGSRGRRPSDELDPMFVTAQNVPSDPQSRRASTVSTHRASAPLIRIEEGLMEQVPAGGDPRSERERLVAALRERIGYIKDRFMTLRHIAALDAATAREGGWDAEAIEMEMVWLKAELKDQKDKLMAALSAAANGSDPAVETPRLRLPAQTRRYAGQPDLTDPVNAQLWRLCKDLDFHLAERQALVNAPYLSEDGGVTPIGSLGRLDGGASAVSMDGGMSGMMGGGGYSSPYGEGAGVSPQRSIDDHVVAASGGGGGGGGGGVSAPDSLGSNLSLVPRREGGSGSQFDSVTPSSSLGSLPPRGSISLRRSRGYGGARRRAPDRGWGTRPPPPFLPYSPSVIVHLPKSISSIQPATPIAPLFADRATTGEYSPTYKQRARRCDEQTLSNIRASYHALKKIARLRDENTLAEAGWDAQGIQVGNHEGR